MSDLFLHKRILKADERALDEIVTTYSNLLWTVASSIITSHNSQSLQDIEEVVSDVFLRYWQEPKKFNAKKGTLKNYLALMTRSLALNKIKSQKRHEHEQEESLEYLSVPAEDTEVWQLLFDFVIKMDEPTRTILLYRFFYELKPAEIV
jgi:RNA polymerase sigma-70 factor, ECF subfamily